jgi:hypothetical protein
MAIDGAQITIDDPKPTISINDVDPSDVRPVIKGLRRVLGLKLAIKSSCYGLNPGFLKFAHQVFRGASLAGKIRLDLLSRWCAEFVDLSLPLANLAYGPSKATTFRGLV